jgi:hypothetical protein
MKNPYNQDKIMVWMYKTTHKTIKQNAEKKRAKLYAYLDYIIKLGLKEEERRKNENNAN